MLKIAILSALLGLGGFSVSKCTINNSLALPAYEAVR